MNIATTLSPSAPPAQLDILTGEQMESLSDAIDRLVEPATSPEQERSKGGHHDGEHNAFEVHYG